MLQKYGAYALLVGLAIAVIVGIFPKAIDRHTVYVVLLILGVIGGAMSVSSENTADFLMAGVALMLAAKMDLDFDKATTLGDVIRAILENVYVVTAAATIVLAVKTILSAAKGGGKAK